MTPLIADWGGETDSLCTAIVSTIADAKGVDPVDLDTTLYEVIDPDALERIFTRRVAGEAERCRLTFQYDEFEVAVADDGTIAVTRDTRAPPIPSPAEE